MHSVRVLAFLFLSLLMLPGCSAFLDVVEAVDQVVDPDLTEHISYMQGDVERDVIISYPESITAYRQLPVVIHLHGTGSGAAQEQAESGLTRAAAYDDFIAVFPQALSESGWDLQGDSDVEFLSGLMQTLVRDHKADPERLYVSGVGNGGAMALKLVCVLAHRIAGAASISGALPADTCRAARPVPVFLYHGSADLLVPFGGGDPDPQVGLSGPVMSVADTAMLLAERNRCLETPRLESRGRLDRTEYFAPVHGSEVVLYALKDAGHGWPVRQEEGNPGLAWVVLEFFAQH